MSGANQQYRGEVLRELSGSKAVCTGHDRGTRELRVIELADQSTAHDETRPGIEMVPCSQTCSD